MEMCRFTGLDDVEYKKVAAALRRMSTMASRVACGPSEPLLSEEQKRELLASLKFDQIDARQMTIKNAHAKTCKWLLENPIYRNWLDPMKLREHNGFLWIKGKPGTGKSTLVKYTLNSTRRRMRETIAISFFFNARGGDLEKSTSGMYRSLLLQLLDRIPALQSVFDSLGSVIWNGACHSWSVESLKSLFEQAVQNLGDRSLACFIDALDECDEHQIRDMVSFFEHLGDLTTSMKSQFRVCFSSRHYPHITIAKGLGLTLEGQEGHGQDIVNYVSSELKIGHNSLAEQIRTELREKAAGVFMWVVLVVEILNKEYDRGRVHALRRRLRDIPGDLHELFRDILTRDQHNRSSLLLCIQSILFARRPLNPGELYYAILSGTETDPLSAYDPEEITESVIRRFILDSSKGLAEITKSSIPTVQFIHESVRDFLLRRDGWKEIWPDIEDNFEGCSHDQLTNCCMRHMDVKFWNIAESPLSEQSREDAEPHRLSDKTSPFLEYAVQNVLYHADAAAALGIDQDGFLQNFPRTDWIVLNNQFERHHVRRYKLTTSLLYILSERNTAALVENYRCDQSCFDVEDERFGAPLFAALATKSDQAVRAFVKIYKEMLPSGSILHKLHEQLSGGGRWLNLDRSFTFSKRRNALFYVAELKDEAFFALFALAGPVYARDPSGRTSLFWAAESEHEAIVRLLLDKGADIEARDSSGRTSLLHVAQHGPETIVRLLLDRGADIEAKDAIGNTPLSEAAWHNHEAIVRLLLDRGADIEAKNTSNSTPLLESARCEHEATIRLLLDRDADTEARNISHFTPLWESARWGHEATVRLLLDRGADIMAKDETGRTVLEMAAGVGRSAIVRLLSSHAVRHS